MASNLLTFELMSRKTISDIHFKL